MPYLHRLNRTRLLPDKCRTLLINTVRLMNIHALILTVLATSIGSSSGAEKPVANPFEYSILAEGEKVTFDQLERRHLGKQCTVYFKRGRLEIADSVTGRVRPAGPYVADPHTKQNLLIGELYALSLDGIRLRWYYNAERSARCEIGATIEEIDYIIFKSKKRAEAGADQPATKPADKGPEKVQPTTQPSKDAPR